MQDPKPTPQAVTKKKKKSRQVKAVGEGLEGFVDWTNLEVSQSTEEREAEMSSLIVGFSIRIRKIAANAREGTTLDLEVQGHKRSRPSRSDEEVQVDPAMIAMDTLE